ncbi:lipase family protein [Paenibacillus sp. H1-7]|uniref:lipase family protein n=1 Tax=Paenibacillus sp. H1-7 TaxID=2282849 RepID=UPI001EF95E37|nr:lipase family protein [Paenibacillus sp. H1-7]ULL16654.1 lipase family protein [Paenibacillus sp. H1-7]
MSKNLFDIQTAILLSALCSQSYQQFESADGTFVLPRHYQLVTEFEAASFTGRKEPFGFIAEAADRIVLVFRGTNTKSEWISDAIARQTTFPYVKNSGSVHQGFLGIYESARQPVLSALQSLSRHKPLYITGHSLGGALAHLCAVDTAVNSGFSDPIVYTYASPRVGDPEFSSTFNQLFDRHRIHNPFDLVPQLPPILYKSPKTGQTYTYLHAKKSRELPFQKGSVAANHNIANYFTELALQDPTYAQLLCTNNPGLCPITPNQC